MHQKNKRAIQLLDRLSSIFYKLSSFLTKCRSDAQVAQLVEQWTENPRVGGSIPPLGTTSQVTG